MPRSIEEIQVRIAEATRAGFRGRLLARGFARNLIWSKGQLPAEAPAFSPNLSTDLLSYGLGLFRLGLELRGRDKTNTAAIDAFARAAEALESVIRDGDPTFDERGFFTIIAASAYHLAHFSARAFSLFPPKEELLNFSPAERALALIMRRDLTSLRKLLCEIAGNEGFDGELAKRLEATDDTEEIFDEGENLPYDESVYMTLETLFYQALAVFDFGLETGQEGAIAECLHILDEGILASSECTSVPFWWVFTIARHLLDDLWEQSLHVRLPSAPPDEPTSRWLELRWLFISTLLKQNRSEIELWPSQIAAATRAIDVNDDLVVTLPTSAGKTRIAEICILRALSFKQRVVFVTPLRALSAQTERSLRKTFVPLGFTVSSLYGSSGSTGDDVDSLRNRDIVISTPEKLDFALRNDPELLDSVGLIVLDEAHTIGAGEREVRYEVLVQRLLRRTDAAKRRIVCLSAILPQGEQLEDFVAWIRQDQPGDAVSVNWRPTRQRFGEIRWEEKTRGRAVRPAAVLSFRVEGATGADVPYLDPFLMQVPALGKQRTPLPRNRRDLCLLSAWRLVEEGQTVLIYCPERRSVMPAARDIIDMVSRGYLNSLLTCDIAKLTEALSIGREWLGEHHPAVQCLRLGIAVHHGQLPRPFLRAVERLLKEQLLKITIASPTLAQGLNLSATTVLFSGLKRGMSPISGEEFANVAGRAGRAFVDVEGQILCVAWDRRQLWEWDRLLQAAKERNLKSGLLQLILDFANRIKLTKGYSIDQVLQYVMGNANLWEAPKPGKIDNLEEQEAFEGKWQRDLASLDSAILSIVGHDVPDAELSAAIDTALNSSLWERSLIREDEQHSAVAKALLQKRTEFIWQNSTAVQRKGYFFAGISFDTGRFLDQHAEQLNVILGAANDAFATDDVGAGCEAAIEFAKIVFQIPPFEPDRMLEDWENILRAWVSGASMSDLAGDMDEHVIEFIESALVYRLVWAMEAVRVRQSAEAGEDDDQNAGRAALALETGTAKFCAALLIQSGLSSRIAATKAIADCPADFTDLRGLRAWLRSDVVTRKETQPSWPTAETFALWHTFVDGFKIRDLSKWEIRNFNFEVKWLTGIPPQKTQVRLVYDSEKRILRVLSINLQPLGVLPNTWKKEPSGLFLAEVSNAQGELFVTYHGPRDF